MPTYRRTDLRFVSGNGAWLETEAGERYLDFGSGIAVNTLGHAHPRLVDALKGQAEKLWHVSNLYEIPAKKLWHNALCGKFCRAGIFCNSGSEAAEGMIKAMRKFHAAQGQTERVTLIGFAGAFHGRTFRRWPQRAIRIIWPVSGRHRAVLCSALTSPRRRLNR